MQGNHTLSPQLGATTRFGIEMVLPFAAHQNLPILGDFEAF